MVLVTDGNQRSTLAVVRSLGRAGIPVTVGESALASLAGSSRYCTRRVCYPSPYHDAEGFKRFVSSDAAQGEYKMLIAMTDVSARLLAEMQQKIAPRVLVPMPAAEAVRRSQDKAYVLALAQQLGIPSPRTLNLLEGQNVREAAQSIAFPAVVKPRFSYFYQSGRWRSGEIRYADSPDELAVKYTECAKSGPQPLVQEKLSGEGLGVFLLVWNGELKGAFCHRRLREKPPWGGISVYRESIPLDHNLVSQSLSLLKALDWQGVAMVEFKLDKRDGLAKLMEVNGRFWGSLQLAIDAGMDFPLLLYRLASGESVPPQCEYRVGVKSRWLLGDLDHLLITLRHSGHGNGRTPQSRLHALSQFLKFYEPGIRYEVFRLEDPRPGWFEAKCYLQAMLRSGGVGG